MSEEMAFGVVMLVWLAIMLAFVIFATVVWYRIFEKAGHSGWMGLLMLIPIVNVVAMLILAFGEWPIHRELAMLRQQSGLGRT